MRTIGTMKALGLSTSAEWETPPEIFNPLHNEFHFTLDVCATESNTKCERFFTARTNGLAQPWASHRCWMNPPYGKAIHLWMAKAWHEARQGALVVALVPARTDTVWWHETVEAAGAEKRFIRGRVIFLSDGRPIDRPIFPSVIVIFRPPT